MAANVPGSHGHHPHPERRPQPQRLLCTLAQVRRPGDRQASRSEGVVTGNVWFLVDKEAVIKGSPRPADGASRIRIHSKLSIDASVSNATITASLLANNEVKLSGSNQTVTGLIWGTTGVDMSGSQSRLTGAVVTSGLLKIAGSDRSMTYDVERHPALI